MDTPKRKLLLIRGQRWSGIITLALAPGVAALNAQWVTSSQQ
ncbi:MULTISPECIES: hypothetical protein [Prochlorococcus]|nr:hypothetical protein [Prochlorococcus marinus]